MTGFHELFTSESLLRVHTYLHCQPGHIDNGCSLLHFFTSDSVMLKHIPNVQPIYFTFPTHNVQ